MNDRAKSRRALLRGMASVAGVTLAGCSQPAPPTYGNLLRIGDVLTYRAHRLLLPRNALVREYDLSDISSHPAIGTTDPADPRRATGFTPEHAEAYDRFRRNRFADWRLSVEGKVSRPLTLSLDDLKRLQSRTQITRHTCEEGWSAIAQWTGVPLRTVLEAAGISPAARFVHFFLFESWTDSIDMLDALHPQTILAYGMNGRDLPIAHGAPLRLRVETQLGYKSVKFLRRIVVTDDAGDPALFEDVDAGWSWYAGI